MSRLSAATSGPRTTSATAPFARACGVVLMTTGCIASSTTSDERNLDGTVSSVDVNRPDAIPDAGTNRDAELNRDNGLPGALPAWVYLQGLAPVDFLESDPYPGQDLCSLTFTCPHASAGFSVEAVVELGWGIGLDASDDPDFQFPDDPELALGPEDQECGYRSPSDTAINFVTIGHEGSIYLRLDTENHDAQPATQLDLSGCTLSIQTADGVVEPTLVSVCLEPRADTCRFLAEIPYAYAPDGVKVLVQPL